VTVQTIQPSLCSDGEKLSIRDRARLKSRCVGIATKTTQSAAPETQQKKPLKIGENGHVRRRNA
jgi:hypothetical protein